MKLFYPLFLFCLTISVANAQQKFIFQDEFSGKNLDTTKWSYNTGGEGWGNHELQNYTKDRKENVRIENGHLIIEARKEDFNKNRFTSGRIVTKGKFDFTYGRVEVRAKLPAGRGTWPAIWMLASGINYGKNYWPDQGEIDIMEHVGYDPSVVHGTVHTKAFNHVIGTQKGNTITITDFDKAFHVYRMDWTPETIRMFVDDKMYFEFPNTHKSWEEWPFDKPEHLILNLAVGGDWGGSKGVDESIFPVRMEVDYVRVLPPPALRATPSL
ncbi:glycoside hydrolase family 16 protein [Sandaracinomonas limnophila]|uniref:Glycoside hydrolase family 16 protein n=1 Tax=Sandaracinomonas limnophila TaxID=1862386 RepID=A0A437PUM8_9BACT|nr:glycoside hydrolase family 16 protein [Sandaracinomonas limnophila]RVU25969.1 glycoside hydrolase family 16 protein [Sandaracinomonas limnophila]